MKKILIFAIDLLMLLMLLIPLAYTTKPQGVEGTFEYEWWPIGEPKLTNGNLFIQAVEHEQLSGDFEGEANATFTVTVHKSEFDEDGNLVGSSFMNVWLRSFFKGEVDGKSGRLVIQLVGKKPGAGADQWWKGQWVIISGTDELKTLHGRGTWWGPGFGAPGPDIYYSGSIHFS